MSSKNRQAVELGYTEFKVNGLHFPDYDAANDFYVETIKDAVDCDFQGKHKDKGWESFYASIFINNNPTPKKEPAVAHGKPTPVVNVKAPEWSAFQEQLDSRYEDKQAAPDPRSWVFVALVVAIIVGVAIWG